MQTLVYIHSGKLQIRSSTSYICLHNQPSAESTDAPKCLHTQQTAISVFSTFNISTLTRPLDESTMPSTGQGRQISKFYGRQLLQPLNTYCKLLNSPQQTLLLHFSSHLLQLQVHSLQLSCGPALSTLQYSVLLLQNCFPKKRLLHLYTARLPRRYHDPQWMGRQILNCKHVDLFGRAV